MILEPDYGVGAYKISGGASGGFLLLGLGLIGLLMFVVLTTVAATITSILFTSLAIGLLIKQASDFSSLWSDVASSNCTHETKSDLMRDMLFLLVMETLAVLFLEKMKSNASSFKEDIITMVELISVDGLGYILGELSDGITESQVKACG